MDSRYIVTGSEDDTNVRIWKARAADPLKPLLPREKESLAYKNKLKKKCNACLLFVLKMVATIS